MPVEKGHQLGEVDDMGSAVDIEDEVFRMLGDGFKRMF